MRTLLDFPDPAFEDAGRRFHETEREIFSPNAAKVRRPYLYGDTMYAKHLGVPCWTFCMQACTCSVERSSLRATNVCVLPRFSE